MSYLTIKSNLRDYKAIFEDDFSFINELIEIENCVFLIDKNVYEIYQNYDGFKSIKDFFLINAIENNKTIEYAFHIYDYLLNKEAKRNITIISIGGGITQDVTGFVASTLYRGINWIYLPTTLLAQTDSCIGSKTSLNYQSYKNIIGSFYPPNIIYICPMFLDTISEVDFYSGLGEVIKLQLMKPEFNLDKIVKSVEVCKKERETLLKIIYENLMTKIKYLENDEFDLGIRNLLNYGHCFGHAIEMSTNYAIPHGIAVTIGIIFANSISLNRRLIPKDMYDAINNRLLKKNIHIPLKKEYFNTEKILNAMKNDKKRQGKYLSVVFPEEDMGLAKVNDLTTDEFLQGLDLTKNQLI